MADIDYRMLINGVPIADVLEDIGLVGATGGVCRCSSYCACHLVVVIEVDGHRREVSLRDVAVGIRNQRAGSIAALPFVPRPAVHPGNRCTVVRRQLNRSVRCKTLPVHPRTPAEIPVAGQEGVDL